jgi:hypothetical protein
MEPLELSFYPWVSASNIFRPRKSCLGIIRVEVRTMDRRGSLWVLNFIVGETWIQDMPNLVGGATRRASDDQPQLTAHPDDFGGEDLSVA